MILNLWLQSYRYKEFSKGLSPHFVLGGTSQDPAAWTRPLATYAKRRVNLYAKGR